MSKIFNEFKEFAFKGNVVDMAVGVLVGSAFSGIVNSIVKDLVTPLIAAVMGSVDFSSLNIMLGEGEDAPCIGVGSFVETIMNFFIIAICIFAMVKFINKLRKPAPAPAPAKEARKCPFCKSEIADDATRCPHCTSQL